MIAIIGAKGQLGLELSHLLCDYNIKKYDINTMDITKLTQIQHELHDSVKIIINCAAYTNVDKCEEEIEMAYKVNAIGARNLAIVANEIGAKIIHISTDYVFDGKGITAENGDYRQYNEFDYTNPQSIYGKSKLEGENFVRSLCGRHFILRTAWLYGEGNNFVRTMLKLAETKDELKVVNDQFGTPTSTKELARLIKTLIETENYGTFHATCEGSCTWYEFAKEIFNQKNIDINVMPCTTQEFKRVAPRPKYSILDNYMLKLTTDFTFKHWKDALKEYLDKER